MTSITAALGEIQLSDTTGQQVRLGSLWASSGALFTFLRHYG